MADNDEEGEWSPWEKEDGIMDMEKEEHQPLIESVPHQLEVNQLDQEMDGTAPLLFVGGPSLICQYLTTVAATMGAFSMGCVLGYSSPAGPMLMSNSTHNPVHLTADENNWFASALNLGALVGAPVCGVGLGTLGRRGTMLASVVPFVGGWLLIALAKNFAMLMAGRILTGLCCGISSMAIPTYIGEYASSNVRGTLGASFQLMVTIGLMYAYVAGAFVTSWQMLGFLCGIPPIIYFVLMLFTKESPTFLLSKGKEQKAKESLQSFRGKHQNIQTELDMLRQTLEEARHNKASLRDLFKPYILKPLVISMALMLFQQFSGVNPVLFNLAIIFEDAGSTLKAAYSSIIIAAVQVVATFLSVILMDKAGRRLLLILSASLMVFSLAALGIFFYLKMGNEAWAVKVLGWLPLLSLIIFITFFSIGYGPVPWLMMGELFSPNIREVAASVATLSNWTLSFIATLIFAPLKGSIGDYGVYWLFSAVCVVNLIFSVTFVPETKGKTLEEITAYFGAPSQTSRRSSRSDV